MYRRHLMGTFMMLIATAMFSTLENTKSELTKSFVHFVDLEDLKKEFLIAPGTVYLVEGKLEKVPEHLVGGKYFEGCVTFVPTKIDGEPVSKQVQWLMDSQSNAKLASIKWGEPIRVFGHLELSSGGDLSVSEYSERNGFDFPPERRIVASSSYHIAVFFELDQIITTLRDPR